MPSTLPTPRSATPSLSHSNSVQMLSPVEPLKHEHSTTFSHKLANMFNSAPYSVFQANVTIHELANVPQLAGQFAVHWKFRGHKPKTRDFAVSKGRKTLENKPSLPNMRLSAIDPSPSSSSVSVQTSSTSTTTTTNSPLVPSYPQSARTPSSSYPTRMAPHPAKSMSLPPPGMSRRQDSRSRIAEAGPSSRPTEGGKEKVVEKKASDPTPLRQSMAAPSLPVRTDSPAPFDEPEEDEESGSESRERLDSQGSGNSGSSGGTEVTGGSGTGGSGSSGSATLDDSALDTNGRVGGPRTPKTRLDPSPQIIARDHATESKTSLASAPPTTATQMSRTGSAASSLSHLAAPQSRASPVMLPGPRSGNSPSASALVVNAPSTEMPPPRLPLTRHASAASASTTGSNQRAASTTSVHSSLNILRRRATSGPAPEAGHSVPVNHRKGETPARSLKAHTCTWDFEIEHTIRVPLYRPTGASLAHSTPGSATPTGRSRIPQNPHPTVGAGPLSDSGMRLTIYQIPSSSTSSSATTDKNNNGSGIATQHQDGKQGKSSESRHSTTDSIKTVFGTVDIDLAAFAGKGPMTRRFLLRGSRTNATISVSVHMRWVGGDDKWSAPPMQQGHHVTGIHDLVGADAEERIRGDLALKQTPSNSSSNSSIISGRTVSNPSSNDPSRSPSRVDLPLPGTGGRDHPTYDQHLKAKDATRVPSSSHLDNHIARNPSRASSYSQHSHHSAHIPASALALPHTNPTLSSNRFSTPHRHHHHRHHVHHLRDPPDTPRGDKIESLPAEVIIEAIFNPRAASEESPFTYIPQDRSVAMQLEGGQAVLQRVIASAAGGGDDAEKKSISTQGSKERDGDGDGMEGERSGAGGGGGREKLGWGERMRQRRERKASRKFGQRAVSTPPIAVE